MGQAQLQQRRRTPRHGRTRKVPASQTHNTRHSGRTPTPRLLAPQAELTHARTHQRTSPHRPHMRKYTHTHARDEWPCTCKSRLGRPAAQHQPIWGARGRARKGNKGREGKGREQNGTGSAHKFGRRLHGIEDRGQRDDPLLQLAPARDGRRCSASEQKGRGAEAGAEGHLQGAAAPAVQFAVCSVWLAGRSWPRGWARCMGICAGRVALAALLLPAVLGIGYRAAGDGAAAAWSSVELGSVRLGGELAGGRRFSVTTAEMTVAAQFGGPSGAGAGAGFHCSQGQGSRSADDDDAIPIPIGAGKRSLGTTDNSVRTMPGTEATRPTLATTGRCSSRTTRRTSCHLLGCRHARPRALTPSPRPVPSSSLHLAAAAASAWPDARRKQPPFAFEKPPT